MLLIRLLASLWPAPAWIACARARLFCCCSRQRSRLRYRDARRGQLPYFEAHRGYTHSLLLLPVMALVCVAVTARVYRGNCLGAELGSYADLAGAAICCSIGPTATEFGCSFRFLRAGSISIGMVYTTGASW